MATISIDMIPPDLDGVPWRIEDVNECLDLGLSIEEAIRYSMTHSTESYAIRFNNSLVAVWGYAASPFDLEARLWLLSTTEADAWQYRFARSSYRVVVDLLSRFHAVSAQVSDDHAKALEWLTWLGFVERSRNGKILDVVCTRETVLWAS